jgi:hypothetical protein
VNNTQTIQDFNLSNRPLSFPQLGGAYDRYSLLIYTEVKGHRTYKNRLDKFVSQLAKDLMASAKLVGIEIKTKRKDLDSALQYLVHSFAHVASTPSKYRYVSLSLNRNDYYGTKAQFNMLSHNHIQMAVELLEKCVSAGNEPFIYKISGHRNRTANTGLRTRLEPSKAFLNLLTIEGLVFPGHPYGLKKNAKRGSSKPLLQIKLEDSQDAEPTTKPLDRTLNSDEEVLVPLNEKLQSLKVDFSLPNYSVYQDNWNFKTGQSKLRHMSGNELTRQFKSQDGNGGRLYGHWVQQCPSGLRPYITFNGKETIELDYGSMQLFLLYGLAGCVPPDNDLYEFPRVDRGWMKAILTRSVGANTRDEAIASLRAEMAATSSKILPRAEEFFDLFWERHKDVYHLLFKGETWARLQYLDSTIALRVIKLLLSNNIVCIPIHDSFIVQKQHEVELRTAMQTAFKSLFPKIDPMIK